MKTYLRALGCARPSGRDHAGGRSCSGKARGHVVPQAVRRDARVHARPAAEAEDHARRQDGPLPPRRAEAPKHEAVRVRCRQRPDEGTALARRCCSRAATRTSRPRRRPGASGSASASAGSPTSTSTRTASTCWCSSRASSTCSTARPGKATELKTGEGGRSSIRSGRPDGKKVAYVRGFDVYVYDLATEQGIAGHDGRHARSKTHGLAEFVAQEEMGRFSGYWWSPDSKHIAYEEADHTGVETWYVADPLKPDQKPAEQFYPRPGKKNVRVRLGVVPVEGGGDGVGRVGPEEIRVSGRVVWEKHGPLTVLCKTASSSTACVARPADTETGT